MRNNFIFYVSYYECIKEMPEEAQGTIYKAIVEYAMEQKEPKLTGIAKGIFKLVKPMLDKAQKQYENGIKGGRPKTQTETEMETQGETNTNPNKTQIVTQGETQQESQPISNKNLDKNKNNNKKNKQEQELIEKEKINKKEKSLDDVLATIEDTDLVETLKQFIKHRKGIKKPLTTYGLELLLKNLNKITPNIFEQVEILNYSIINGWQGVFPLKDGKKGKSSLEDDLARVNEIVGGI